MHVVLYIDMVPTSIAEAPVTYYATTGLQADIPNMTAHFNAKPWEGNIIQTYY